MSCRQHHPPSTQHNHHQKRKSNKEDDGGDKTTKKAVYIQQIITKMGHPQPQNPIQTKNWTVEGVINNKIQPKQTKAMDMCFYWLRDCTAHD
jgi:hypothetical protein